MLLGNVLMSVSRRHLASAERRMAAFVIDLLILLFVTVFVLGVADAVGLDTSFVLVCDLGLFLVYHSIGLINPNYAIGRVIIGISVVSIQAGPDLSSAQCFARPVIRILWLLLSIVPAWAFHDSRLLTVTLLVDIGLLTFHPLRQTVADLLCRTTVVITPPVQPHRAPAGPMFSANDAEFGPKPKR